MSVADDAEIEQKVTDLEAPSQSANVSEKTGQDLPRPSPVKDDPNQKRPTPKSSRVSWPEGEPAANKSLPDDDDDKPRNGDCSNLCEAFKRIYNDPYRWEIVTGTVMFFLALELTRELWGIAFPIRVYQPFWRFMEAYKCIIRTWSK